ncbi:MAG: carboxypeptidase-like regulatory domain-containing protein, partial [Deltaproteobacteria bacterium]|nr:carboxypeptidase-like regulatory domain-containing protein [Deltaproteobacteria bacterium]
MNQRLVIVLAVVAILGGGLFYWRHHSHQDNANSDSDQASKKLGQHKLPTIRKKDPAKGQGQRMPMNQVLSFDDDPEGDMMLEGIVLDAYEQPAPGVTVSLSSNPRRFAKTGEDGTFSFDKLVGRSYAVAALHDGKRAGPISHLLTKTSEPVVLKLREGATVVVEVRDEADRPVAGADVQLRALAEQTETTDRDGIATFKGVSPGWHFFVASASGLAPGRSPAQVPDGGGITVRARITMKRGVPVSGVVVAHDGKPVEGARVAAFPAATMLPGVEMRKDGVSSDKRGKFTIPAVATGSYRLVAVKQGYPAASSEPTMVGASAVGGVEIRFEEAARLAGRVIDGDGAPVPWAQVRVKQRSSTTGGMSGATRQATAGEDGSFELEGLPRKKIVALALSDTASSELLELDLADGDVSDAELTLTLEGTIAGVVVDSAGEPISEAQVVAFPDFWKGERAEGIQLRGVAQVRTDPGGRFTLAGLPEAKYRVRASRSGSQQSLWQSPGVEASVGDKEVRIVLPTDGGIKGELRNEAGGNPELFTVIPRFPPGTPVVSEQGEFEVRDLPPGRYDVTFRGPNFQEKTVRDVEIKEGAVTNMGTIDVIRGRAITGRVVDRNGSAVEGANVLAGLQIIGDGSTVVSPFGEGSDQMQKVRRAVSGENGEYTLTGVGAQELVVVAEHPDKGRSLGIAVPAQPQDSQVELTVLGYGRARGKVTIGGEPVAGVQVIATGKSGSGNHMLVVASGQDGSYAFDKLAAGDYQLKAMSAGFGTAQTGSAEGTIRAGGTARVDIDIEVGELDIA